MNYIIVRYYLKSCSKHHSFEETNSNKNIIIKIGLYFYKILIISKIIHIVVYNFLSLTILNYWIYIRIQLKINQNLLTTNFLTPYFYSISFSTKPFFQHFLVFILPSAQTYYIITTTQNYSTFNIRSNTDTINNYNGWSVIFLLRN